MGIAHAAFRRDLARVRLVLTTTPVPQGTPASFKARVIRAALCPASRWANIHVKAHRFLR
jgi:hypothetical protein